MKKILRFNLNSISIKSILAGSLFFLFFFKATAAYDVLARSDTGCYVSHLAHFLFLPVDSLCPNNFYAPGAPLTWLPAGVLGLLMAVIFRNPVMDWIIPSAAIYSFLFWGLSLYWVARIFEDQLKLGFRWALFFVLSSPLLFYATRVPLMSHTTEFLFTAMTLFFMYQNRFLAAGITGIFLTFTRFNDMPILLLVLARMFDQGQFKLSKKYFLTLSGLTLLGLSCASYIAFIRGYGGAYLPDLLKKLSAPDAMNVLIGSDWGLIWTATPWVFSWLVGLIQLHRRSWLWRTAWLWMTLEFLICTAWQGNGNQFAYRYLIGSYGAALVIWTEWLTVTPTPLKWSSFKYLITVCALWLTYLTTAFRSLIVLGRYLQYRDGPDGYMVPLGYPDFVFHAAQNIFNINVYRVMFYQQVPLVTTYLSVFGHPDPAQQENMIQGPKLFLLEVTCAAALLAVFFSVKTLIQSNRSARQTKP